MNKAAVTIDQAIRGGAYAGTAALPSVADLAEEYGHSEEETRDGLSDLVYEGVLERVPGQASAVRIRAAYLWDVVRGNHSFTSEAKQRGQKPGNRILTFETRRAWPQIIQRLQLEEGDDILVMERLLFGGETPVGLEFSYMPAKYYEGATREMFEGGQSTFSVMEGRGLIPDRGVDELAVATLGEREAALFGMDAGVPVMIRFRVTLAPDCRPIKGSRAIYLFRPGYQVKI